MRRLLLLLPIGLLVIVSAAYLALNTWLESAAGRIALEQALAERIGMSVNLRGDFDIMFFPAIGVTGSGLVIGESADSGPFASSGRYDVAVAIRPLFERRILIESVKLRDGTVYPDRYSRTVKDSGQPKPGGPILPEVRSFSLEDFQINFPGDKGLQMMVSELSFSDFSVNKATHFSIEVVDFGSIAGEMTLHTGDSVLDLALDWSAPAYGELALATRLDLQELSGSIDTEFLLPMLEDKASLSTQYIYRPEGILLPGIVLEFKEQQVVGNGCVLPGDPAALNLFLQTSRFDLDTLPQNLPESDDSGAGLPVDVRLRFEATEISGRGAVARGALLKIGEEPDCSKLHQQ